MKTATHTSSPSLTPTQEPSPTHQPDTPTPTITDTSIFVEAPTPTVPPEARLDYQCLEINAELPARGIYTGSIVLAGYDQVPTYLLDLSTGDKIPLLGDDKQVTYGEVASPDRKWLAYNMPYPGPIIVDSLAGELAPISIPWNDNWFSLEGWLNNQTLLVSGEGDSPNMVIYPFSGEQDAILSDFPEYNTDPGTWFEQYNPQLTRVVYTKFPDLNGSYIALWNLQSQEMISAIYSYPGAGPYGTQPVWAPGGTEFIMSLFHKGQDDNSSGYTELYRISQDGDQHQITNLQAYYTEYLFVQEYQWSPDESKVAFWLRYSHGDQSKNQLAVLDMETYQVINYCINDRFGTSRELVWSLDGRKIIVNAKYDEEPAVLLIDLGRQVVYRIAGDMKAVGWMDTSP